MRPDLTGHYYRVLGIAAIFGFLGNLLMDPNSFVFDCNMIINLWLASYLLRGNGTAWRIAVALSCLGVAASLAFPYLATGIFLTQAQEVIAMDLAFVQSTAGFLFSAFPLIHLLLPSTRHAYFDDDVEWNEETASWSGTRIVIYVSLASLLTASGAALQRHIHDTSVVRGYSSSVRYWIDSSYQYGLSSVRWVKEEETGEILYISSWILGEPGLAWSKPEDEIFVGDVKVPVPRPPATHYLFHAPEAPRGEPNIFLVYDGQLVVVPRRVTPETLDEAHRVIKGAPSFEDVRSRLEDLLPPLDGPTP